MNEEPSPTFTTVPPASPSSSSHSSLSLPHRQAQTPQSPSHPMPPLQQTPHQQPHTSPTHFPERFSAPMHNPTRPQSWPQRPSYQQQTDPSLTPYIPPGTLPPNATLLQGHSVSISSVSPPPLQPGTNISTTVRAGSSPLTLASSTEEDGDLSPYPGSISSVSPPPPQPGPNISTIVRAGSSPSTLTSSTEEDGDPSPQPGATGIRPPMPRYVYHPISSLCLLPSLRIGSVVSLLQSGLARLWRGSCNSVVCSRLKTRGCVFPSVIGPDHH